MIHLTVQDIALLANLADCCNSVDEFVEYLNKTYGWGTTPLSARSDHDGEFVISYGTLQDITQDQTQDKRVSTVVGVESSPLIPSHVLTQAVKTIQEIQARNGADYVFDQYASIEKIAHAHMRGDYLMALYAGVQKLKHSFTTDYRVNALVSLLGVKLYRPEPYNAIYYTIKKIGQGEADPNDGTRAEWVATIQTVDNIEHSRIDISTSYQTVDDTLLVQWVDKPKTIQTIDSVELSDHEDVRGSHDTVIYQTARLLEHGRMDDQRQVIDYGVSHISPRRLEHKQDTEQDSAPIARAFAYASPYKLQHVRWNPTDPPVGSGTQYFAPRLIEHVREDESDMPIDRGRSYGTPVRVDHVRWNPTDPPIGSGTQYFAPYLIEHVRWDESDAPVDRGGSYSTPANVQYIRWNPSQMPTGYGVDMLSVYRVQNIQYKTDYHPIGLFIHHVSLGHVSYEHVHVVKTVWAHHLDGVLFTNEGRRVLDVRGMYKFRKWLPEGDTKVTWAHNLDYLLYNVPPGDTKLYTTLGVDELLFMNNKGDTKVTWAHNLERLLYEVPGGDTKVQVVESLDHVKQFRADRTHNFITVDRITGPNNYSVNEPARTTGYDSNNIYYKTIGLIRHEPCSDVRADDMSSTITWATTCLQTTYNNYSPPRATYGAYKIRVVMFQNDTEEATKPPIMRLVRVSDIRLKYRDNQVYDLATHNVTATNCGGCFLHNDKNNIEELFSGNLQTTYEQLTAGKDAGIVQGLAMAVCFTLTGSEPISHVEIAPGGDNGEPRNNPGMVRIDVRSPGTRDWFTVSYGRTERKAIPGMTKHNTGHRVWRLNEYMSFPLLNNDELYRPKHTEQMKICM